QVRDEVDRRRVVDAMPRGKPLRVMQQAALHPLEVVRIRDATGDRDCEQEHLVQRGRGEREPRGDHDRATRRRDADLHARAGAHLYGAATSIVATTTASWSTRACGELTCARCTPANM